jgi:hypothetical protein
MRRVCAGNLREDAMTRPDEPQEPLENSLPLVTPQSPTPVWRRWQWPTAFAFLALAGITVAFIAGNSQGTSVGTSRRAAATASPADARRPAAAAGRRAAVASRALAVTPEAVVASMHVPRQLADALKSWDAGRGGSALASVSIELGNATQAAGYKLFAPMRLACLSLGTAVKDAKADPPIPNAAMQKLYASALGALATAAADCRAGISVQPYGDEDIETHEDPTVLHRSVSEFVTGAKDLYRATVEIRAVSHR